MVEMDEYKKKIRVVNDYDVDGVASGHILYSALKRCGADVSIRVPDRIKDGYGLNRNIIEEHIQMGSTRSLPAIMVLQRLKKSRMPRILV